MTNANNFFSTFPIFRNFVTCKKTPDKQYNSCEQCRKKHKTSVTLLCAFSLAMIATVIYILYYYLIKIWST